MLLSTKHFTNIICLTTNICPSNRLLRSSGLKHIILCPYQLVVYFLIKKKLRRFVNKNMHHKATIGKGGWFSDEETMQFGPIVIEQSCQIALFLTQHGWLPWHCISEPLRKDYPRMPLFSDLTVFLDPGLFFCCGRNECMSLCTTHTQCVWVRHQGSGSQDWVCMHRGKGWKPSRTSSKAVVNDFNRLSISMAHPQLWRQSCRHDWKQPSRDYKLLSHTRRNRWT